MARHFRRGLVAAAVILVYSALAGASSQAAPNAGQPHSQGKPPEQSLSEIRSKWLSSEPNAAARDPNVVPPPGGFSDIPEGFVLDIPEGSILDAGESSRVLRHLLRHEGQPDPNEYSRLRQSAEKGDRTAQYGLGLHHCFNTRDAGGMVEWFRRAAEQGHPKAEFVLGFCYDSGAGVRKDRAEAAKWYREAAEQGHADAQFRLGTMYEEGDGVPLASSEALKWYRKAAVQGHANAQVALGQMYDMGMGVQADYAEAARWYRKAAEQGHADAQCRLAFMCEVGSGVRQDVAQAIGWYRKAAEQGRVEAQAALGREYYYGADVQQDLAEAAKWYRKAAEQGDVSSQVSLGDMYRNGEGVIRDKAEAIQWYRKAAERRNVGAQFKLGVMYSEGEGVIWDFAEAIKWFRMAAEQGDVAAQFNLGVMYSGGAGAIQDRAEAVRWYRKAAEQGFAGAQHNLGLCYVQGDGVEKDPPEGVKWYRRAAEQGEAMAQTKLALCYFKGTGVIEDYTEAYKWALLAGMNGADVSKIKDMIRGSMSPDQVNEAQRQAREFVARKEGSGGEKASSLGWTMPEMVRSSGTGFFFSLDGLILTAQHVVAGAATIKVRTAQGMFPARVLLQDAATDLAVLKVEGVPGLVALPVMTSMAVKAGDSVFTLGFPNVQLQGAEPKYTEGSISSLTGPEDNLRYFQISIPVQPGNSGGPLVNAAGDVVGVVNARLDDLAALSTSGMLPQNVNYAVKSSFVLPFLESMPTFSKPPPSSKAPGGVERSAIIEKVKKAVVLVLCY